MFEDIEEYGGYDQDLRLESEVDNYAVDESQRREQFFPTDKDLSEEEEPEEIERSKRVKSDIYYQPDVLDWYLRVNLDGDCSRKTALQSTNNELFEQTMKKIQVYKGFGGLTTKEHSKPEKIYSDKVSSRNECRIFKFPPRNSINWSAITSLQGQRYYILTKPEENEHNFLSLSKFTNNNLIENFPEILNQAEKLNEQKRNDFCQGEQSMEVDVSVMPEYQNLWVDKYKAKLYTDLLSDDGVNRTLLTWLKLWDECVFKIVKPKTVSTNNKPTPKFPGASNNWKQQNADDLAKDLDQHRRPQHKVTLMCGPPGVGKTTLAHICARHCGYFVHEMNASDDRTLEAFRKQLENATQMTATLDSGSGFRPHCLIIDEIDGAPSSSIDYLVNLIKDGNNDGTSGKKSKKQVLSRPIICICNDLYVPALKELRKLALVLHVPSIEPRRLSDRLSCIGKRENIVLGSPVVEILCEKSENDVRSCINTLQFLSLGKPDRKISAADVNHMDVGLKDLHKSLFSVWQDIFTLPKIKRKRHQESSNSINPISLKSRVNVISTIVDQSGEVDRVVDGLFENFLNVGFKDSGMDMICRGLAWLQSYDRLDNYIAQSQCYEFFSYKKFLPVLFHLYFASPANIPRIQFPQVLSAARFNTTKNMNILKMLLNDMQPSVRIGVHLTPLILEILPYLLLVMQPAFRAVNIQMYSAQEREKLDKLVQLMRSYNLTYRQERAADGQYVFVLEPSVDDIVQYSNVNINRKQLSYVLKQFIAREIEMLKLSSTSEPKLTVKKKDSSKTSEHRHGPVKPKAFEDESSKCKNFFGLPTTTDISSGKLDVNINVDSHRIWFKYNEGSSNAIRRNVRIIDML